MFAILIALHVLACIAMVVIIIIQPGRGEGLSGIFGGGSTQTIFGTRANTFLNRVTAVCGLVFLITCLSLGVLIGRRGRSLLELEKPVPGKVEFEDVQMEEEPVPEPAPAGEQDVEE